MTDDPPTVKASLVASHEVYRRRFARIRSRWRGSLIARSLRGLVRLSAEHRPVLNTALSVVGIGGVALATHVIEQLLGSAKQSAAPGAALVVAFVLGAALLWLRDRVVHQRGTLFYLRLLYPWMRDLHDIALESRLRGHAEDKIIARWIEPGGHRCVDDLTGAVAGVVAETERCLNDDASQTGTHVAPNMMWPAAMAVGYQLPQLARGRVELIELLPVEEQTSRRRRPAASMDWHPRDAILDAVRPADRPRVIWLPATSNKARTVVLLVELTCQGRLQMPRWPADVVGRLTVYQHNQAENEITQRLDRNPRATAAERAAFLHDQDARPVEVDLDERAARARAAAAHAAALQSRPGATDGAGHPLLTLQDFDQELVVLHPRLATEACWRVVREALHRYPEARLLLAMRVPKTIALAVGSLLAVQGQQRSNPGCGEVWAAGERSCWQSSCMNPWQRIVPLMFDEGEHRYRLARVHPFQLPVGQLADVGEDRPWPRSST